jgi:SAM-dependent methyltransferase
METKAYTLIEGIKCYHPEQCQRYADYPDEGFDLTGELEDSSFWCRSRNRLLKGVLLKYCRRRTKTRFLEVGCGTGYFLRDLVRESGFEVTGSEVYLKGLRYTKEKLSGVELVQFDARSIPFREEFDAIGAFDVIEHIDDDEAVIASAHHALKEGGYFIVTVPQYQFLWSSLDDLVRHKRRYGRREMLAKLRNHGFEVVFASSFVSVLFPLMLVSRIFDRGTAADSDRKAEFERRVAMPRALNWLFDKLMRIDEALIGRGVSLPVGGSLLAVARKASPPG